jgi:ribosomal protein L37E
VECHYCGTVFRAERSRCPSCGTGRQRSQTPRAPNRHPHPKQWVDRDGDGRMDPDELE